MPQFSVGEVCLGQNFVQDIELNGRECRVVQVLPSGGWFAAPGSMRLFRIDAVCYYVEWADGDTCHVHESNLRKKPPKELGSWSEIRRVCGWDPTKKRAMLGEY